MVLRQGLYDPANEHDACGVGFVAHIKNHKSHRIVLDGLKILENLAHRGAVAADPLAGDGSGILIQLPDRLLRAEAQRLKFKLPPAGSYGVGMVFLPRHAETRADCEETIAHYIAAEGQTLLGWREVPRNSATLGESIKPIEPVIRQFFVARGANCADADAFERKLFVIRKQCHKSVRARQLPEGSAFYIASLSTRTLIYKGMMIGDRLQRYYKDLEDERTESALALVHARFSTNTFPSWELAHPFRYLAHNGEINTLRGNINWMMARRHNMTSKLLGGDLEKLWPLIGDGNSDSATLDNCLELLVAGGYSLTHALMLMIPEAWADNPLMEAKRRAFYEYHAALMEPWDGPAAIAFTDGRQIGATLDRNGLRPARFCRDIRRSRGDGVGGGRARSSRRAHHPQMAARAGQDAARRSRARAHRRRRRVEGRGRLGPSLPGLARPDPDQARGAARRSDADAAAAQRAARPAAGLRLHAGGSALFPEADGALGRGYGRRHGPRHALGRAVGPAEAAVRLFPAALRASDQSADRFDARIAGDVARHAGRAAA